MARFKVSEMVEATVGTAVDSWPRTAMERRRESAIGKARQVLWVEPVRVLLFMAASSLHSFVRKRPRPRHPENRNPIRNAGTRPAAGAQLRSPEDSRKKAQWNRRPRKQSKR